MSSPVRLTACLVTCLLATAVVASASDGVTVPAGGQIAGHGYGQWLRTSWQLFFRTPPVLPACQSAQTSAGRVGMLMGGYSGKKAQYTCNETAGQPLYVNGLSAECSTLEKPPFHGETPRELERCARRNMKGARNLSASVDGQAVADYKQLISASPVFSIHLPRHNILKSKKRSGESAAYGEGLLIRGLTAGTHTIHVTGLVMGFLDDVTYTLQVS